jgi:hypothetical protein
MQQRLPHGVKDRSLPYYLYNSFRQLRTTSATVGQSRKFFGLIVTS